MKTEENGSLPTFDSKSPTGKLGISSRIKEDVRKTVAAVLRVCEAQQQVSFPQLLLACSFVAE